MNDKDKASIWGAIFALGLFQLLDSMGLSSFSNRNAAGEILPFSLAISLVIYGVSVGLYYRIATWIVGLYYKRLARKNAIHPDPARNSNLPGD